uniref:Uncharacterized protein n=1 Tax=Anser brachyrhynchus TaxID=132585 RepID=A0A8B9BLT4_9AVES
SLPTQGILCGPTAPAPPGPSAASLPPGSAAPLGWVSPIWTNLRGSKVSARAGCWDRACTNVACISDKGDMARSGLSPQWQLGPKHLGGCGSCSAGTGRTAHPRSSCSKAAHRTQGDAQGQSWWR